MAKVTLWRTYWDYKDVKVGSFEVEEKLKTYRLDGRGTEASGYNTIIHKDDIGRKFFFAAEESIRAFAADCQSKIDAALFDIDRQKKRQAMAQALLESYGKAS
jgi:hypothetical protein